MDVKMILITTITLLAICVLSISCVPLAESVLKGTFNESFLSDTATIPSPISQITPGENYLLVRVNNRTKYPITIHIDLIGLARETESPAESLTVLEFNKLSAGQVVGKLIDEDSLPINIRISPVGEQMEVQIQQEEEETQEVPPFPLSYAFVWVSDLNPKIAINRVGVLKITDDFALGDTIEFVIKETTEKNIFEVVGIRYTSE